MGRVISWIRERMEPRPDESVVVRCVRRLVSADARDRVLILAGQAFIAMVPLIIVLATVTSSLDGDAIARYLVTRFSLRADVADSVHALFARPPGAIGGVGVASIVILLFSVNSFSRSIRRTIEMAWELPRSKGFAGARDGLLGVVVALVMVAAVGALHVGAGGSTTGRLLVVVPQLVLTYYGWLLAQWFFLTRRVPRRSLVPGALVGAIVQLGSGEVSSAYMPSLITRNAERYGVIGVSFSLVTWLVIAAAVLVCVAILGAEIGRRGRWATYSPQPIGNSSTDAAKATPSR